MNSTRATTAKMGEECDEFGCWCAWPYCCFSSRGVSTWYNSILTSRISALWLSDDGLEVTGH